jgi:hypothetical protein
VQHRRELAQPLGRDAGDGVVELVRVPPYAGAVAGRLQGGGEGALGIVFLLGMVAFAVLLFVSPPGGSAPRFLVYLLPALLAGAALLTAGILLRRREVSRWSGF